MIVPDHIKLLFNLVKRYIYDYIYLFIKAIHIISFTAWMAGMFYLPRIFVYHSEKIRHKTYNKFLIMEKIN